MPSPLLPYGKSRSLTHGEIMFAQKIFGASIQYTWVKIHHGKYMRFQPDHVVMTPNGEIYFPTRFYQNDYSSTLRHDLKHLFIHEMAHVWQYQLGYLVKIAGIFQSSIGYGYDYKLKPDTVFSDYPMEAQANIIADYAMFDYHSSKGEFKKSSYSLQELQAILKNFINNPSSKENLPKDSNRKCEIEPNSADCLTR
ncbi:MAG: hypothetical protein LBU76_06860 [Azoarcus sp.]|jgi:type VI secretion system secreted protein VgrG|nr:hypothetical protein [Azoarcus sp.]